MPTKFFIKRAEKFHTREYIVNAFARYNHAVVSNVTFIPRLDNDGVHRYNAVVVTVAQWLANGQKIGRLIADLAPTGVLKYVHDAHGGKFYWFVTKFTTENEGVQLPPTSLDDAERISRLEEMVRSQETLIVSQRSHLDVIAREYEAAKVDANLAQAELQFLSDTIPGMVEHASQPPTVEEIEFVASTTMTSSDPEIEYLRAEMNSLRNANEALSTQIQELSEHLDRERIGHDMEMVGLQDKNTSLVRQLEDTRRQLSAVTGGWGNTLRTQSNTFSDAV